jgi:hypothetical protein
MIHQPVPLWVLHQGPSTAFQTPFNQPQASLGTPLPCSLWDQLAKESGCDADDLGVEGYSNHW